MIEFDDHVIIVPTNEDNFAYIVCSQGKACIIDGAEPHLIYPIIEKKQLQVTYILTTHTHYDHSAGNLQLAAKYPEAIVLGSHYESGTPGETKAAMDKDVFTVSNELKFEIIYTPGHTQGHLTLRFFFCPQSSDEYVFTGDFLFLGGCGYFNVSDGPALSYASIKRLYERCQEQAYMFPGHEYSESNLKFAQVFEPNNQAITDKLTAIRKEKPERRVPSTLSQEKSYNPFVRAVFAQDVLAKIWTGKYDATIQHGLLQFARESKNSKPWPKPPI